MPACASHQPVTLTCTCGRAAVIAMVLGIQACALQPSLVAFGSALPRGYCQLLMACQACSAVVTCGLRLVTKAVAPAGGDMGAMAFLLVVGGAQATCALVYACLLRSSFVKYHLEQAGASGLDDGDDDMRFSRFSDVSEDDATEASECARVAPARPPRARHTSSCTSLCVAGMAKATAVSRKSMKDVAPEAFALFLAMVVTFSLFPGEITSLWYHGGSWAALDMLQVHPRTPPCWLRNLPHHCNLACCSGQRLVAPDPCGGHLRVQPGWTKHGRVVDQMDWPQDHCGTCRPVWHRREPPWRHKPSHVSGAVTVRALGRCRLCCALAWCLW